MSLESAERFIKRFREDEQFRLSIEDAQDDDTRRAIRKNAGFEFTKDELEVALTQPRELSVDDLEAVAGGSEGGGTDDSGDTAAAAAVV